MNIPFVPTHEIIFTPATGAPRTILVALAENGAAYTRKEWESETATDWERRGGEWFCRGKTTPGGANGKVKVYFADLHAYEVREFVNGVESGPVAIYSSDSAVEHACKTGHPLRAYDGDRLVWSCDADGEWRCH